MATLQKYERFVELIDPDENTFYVSDEFEIPARRVAGIFEGRARRRQWEVVDLALADLKNASLQSIGSHYVRALVEEQSRSGFTEERSVDLAMLDLRISALGKRNRHVEGVLGGYTRNVGIGAAAFFGAAGLVYMLTGEVLVNHFVVALGFAASVIFAAFGHTIERTTRSD